MAKYLSNLKLVSWASLGVAVVFLLAYAMGVRGLSLTDPLFWSGTLRWAHVLSGIMWIGHLYYFNFTQIPNVPKIPEEARGPAISKVIAPAALYWFRWGAVATLVTESHVGVRRAAKYSFTRWSQSPTEASSGCVSSIPMASSTATIEP